ncbi:hypothetical protein [uncultured Lacinutrix sp.]|uniref:hypothetical protein n=1 Tax=uncultured Lacinutrix sp. TaxID=574032 RepID=UPI00260B4D9B|nr:hypothetical protein [uncultured Lacinutrix sp.]
MKHLYNLIVLMLITSMTVSAQKQNKFSKIFDTDKSTTMIINCDDSSIAIEPSTDGKVHINYNFEFERYSVKEMKKELSKINVGATVFNNNITLNANKLRGEHATSVYKGNGSLFMNIGGLVGFKNSKPKDSIIRKTKDSLIKEITKEPLKKELLYFGDRFKIKEKNGKIKNFRKGNVKIFRSTFIVKIPPYIKLVINGKNAIVNLNGDIINELNVNIKKGVFSAKKMMNHYNKIKVDDIIFKAEYAIGGDYTLNNVKSGKIGVVNGIDLNSEFSKIEIGEIQKGVKLTDFNSEYWIYNFSNNFERFDMFSEYSKIHHFSPETNYSMRAYGHNTINYIGKHKIEMQPNRKGEKFNMMERKSKANEASSGHINFDIIHGIIYTYSDTFTPNKN